MIATMCVCVLSGLLWSVFGFTGGVYMIQSRDKFSIFIRVFDFAAYMCVFKALFLKSTLNKSFCCQKSLFSSLFSLYYCVNKQLK